MVAAVDQSNPHRRFRQRAARAEPAETAAQDRDVRDLGGWRFFHGVTLSRAAFDKIIHPFSFEQRKEFGDRAGSC